MARSWTIQQQAAMNTKGNNILVSAAAGSGKTAVLVERIVNKITGTDNTDIDRLVVVTFTKAAAAEMKARIRNRLDDMLDGDENNANLIRQIALIGNAQITTIDSFCLWILKNHFAQINLDPGFRVADKGEITLLENDVCEEMLEDYYKEGSEEFLSLIDAYGTGRSDANIEEIIRKIYVLARSNPWPDEWYEQVVETYTDNDNTGNKVLTNLYESIMYSVRDYKIKYEYMLELCNRVDGPVSYREAVNSDYMNICGILNSNDFNELSERIIKTEFDRLSNKKMPDAREDLKIYVKTQRDQYKKYISGLLKNIFVADIDSLMKDVHANAPAIKMMVRLSQDFSGRMETEKRERGIVEFSDIEHYALDILVKRENGSKIYTEIADELAEYFDEILIDEYQDSNQLQEEILSAISKGRLGNAPDNMYMVGDVKQSIYKFRLACPELFMKKYYSYSSDGSSGIRIELQKNFRSRQNVLDTTNDVFYRVMNRDYCGIEYDEKQQLNCGLDYPECTDKRNFGWSDEKSTDIVLIDTSEDENNSGVEAESLYMVDRIKSLMSDDNPYYVYDTDISDYRKIRLCDIAVLTRTLSGWADTIVNVLLDNDIPAMADTAQQYFKVREIKVLISLLTCIDNPMQDIPMASVLLSYFGGFTEDELAQLRIYGRKNKSDRLFIKQIQMLVRDICGEQFDSNKDSDNDNNNENNNKKSICNDEGRSNGESDLDISENNEIHNEMADDNINKLVADNDRKYDENEEKLAHKCSIFLDKLNELRDKSRLMTIYDLLWDIVYNTGYYDYVGTMPAGKKRQSNIDVLLDRASSFEGTSYSGLFNFLRYIERLQKYDIELTDSSGTGSNGDAVRVMSIHKSKGLEFPVVIMAGLNKQINKMDARNRLVIDQELGIGTDYVNLANSTRTSTIIKGAIARKILRDSISEEERVLYVAMTRAREKLIMVGSMSGIDKKMQSWQSQADELTAMKTYSYAECENIDKYSDMVMPVALMKEEYNKGKFNIEIIESRKIGNDGQNEDINDSDDMQEQKTDTAGMNIVNSDMAGGNIVDTDMVDSDINIGKNNESDKYNEKNASAGKEEYPQLPPYIKDPDADRKVKVTVTELKQMQADSEYDTDAFMPDEIKEAYRLSRQTRINKKKADGTAMVKVDNTTDNNPDITSSMIKEFVPIVPKFISGNEPEIRANERGTAYHRIMECLDYSRIDSLSDVKADIERMILSERMSRQQAESIKAEDIYTFVSSPVGQRVKMAAVIGNIRREQPFVFEYDRQLVQGVIDLYIIEDGKITIVDYKTDRVRRSKSGEKELIRRYSVQLDYYAKALSQLTGLEVKEKIIYSFTLGREIVLTS